MRKVFLHMILAGQYEFEMDLRHDAPHFDRRQVVVGLYYRPGDYGFSNWLRSSENLK